MGKGQAQSWERNRACREHKYVRGKGYWKELGEDLRQISLLNIVRAELAQFLA